MSRLKFKENLKGHDWYHGYSDDHRVWKEGQEQLGVLRQQHESLECPFSLSTLQKWAHNMIIEDFAEEAPGDWYRQPRIYKSIAATHREGLISKKEFNEIARWLES